MTDSYVVLCDGTQWNCEGPGLYAVNGNIIKVDIKCMIRQKDKRSAGE